LPLPTRKCEERIEAPSNHQPAIGAVLGDLGGHTRHANFPTVRNLVGDLADGTLAFLTVGIAHRTAATRSVLSPASFAAVSSSGHTASRIGVEGRVIEPAEMATRAVGASTIVGSTRG
jgi:hypothetical protein